MKRILIVCFILGIVFGIACADAGETQAVEYPFFHGYAVTGVPCEDFEMNGYVYGTIINETGQPVLEGNWIIVDNSEISGCEDIIFVMEDTDEKLLYGFFDRQSGFFCKPIFDEVSYYTKNSENLVAVQSADELWGFCERSTGEIVIPFRFDGVCFDFENGYAVVIEAGESFDYDERYSLVDRKGEQIVFPDEIMPVSPPNEAGYLIISAGMDGYELYGIGNTNGEIVVYPCYEEEPSLEEFKK